MKKTNLWWISCSRFLSGYSENIIYFLLPIVAYKAVGRIQDTGLIIFIHLSCRLLGYPFSGVLCDKIGEKKVFILVSFVRGAACLLVFWLLGPFHQEQSSLPILMFNLLGIVDGFAGGVASIAFETMGPRLYPNERFRDFQASVQTADQIALIAAPATGVVLLNSLGTSYSLAILGIIFMFAGIMFLPYLKIVSSDGDITPSSLRDSGFIIQEVLASLSIIFNNRLIAVTLILTILDNLLLGIYSAITTPLALVTFHGSEQSLGLALTLGYLASMIAIYYSHWIHQKKSNLWLWKGSYIIAY
ncbi:MAG: MFS transporter, partial [Bdellovibrionia bacterium]